MIKVAFLTTIFPMNEEYLIDFFNSLVNQTNNAFDIIVVNDGYENFDIIKNKYSSLNIIELPYSNSIAKNREYGINWCIDNNYDVLIFGDSDDYFSKNRIELSLEKLKDFDIVVNDLSLFDESGVHIEKYMSNRIKDGTVIDLEFIKDKNIFGLTNTAVCINKIQNVIIEKNIVAVDWFLYNIFLTNGLKAIFTNKCISYYRQHQHNTIGLKCLDGEYLLWGEEKR